MSSKSKGRTSRPVAFVTGGASGIGLETARRLAASGYRIALIDRDAEAANLCAEQLGSDHVGVGADITDPDSMVAAVARVVQHFGGIDVVIANAGIGGASTVRASATEQLLRVIDINLSGQIVTVKAVLEEVIARRGYIIFTASAAALKNTPKANAYAASKAGVEAFAGALRQEIASFGVKVGVFYPAWTRTPMLSRAGSRQGYSATLPWPWRITSEVDDVAELYAEAIRRRARSAYAPRVLRLVHWIKPLYTNAAWDRRLRKNTEKYVAEWESDFLRNRDRSESANRKEISSASAAS